VSSERLLHEDLIAYEAGERKSMNNIFYIIGVVVVVLVVLGYFGLR
jgi:predicted nucleic acid-binding Zn ribbon protein